MTKTTSIPQQAVTSSTCVPGSPGVISNDPLALRFCASTVKRDVMSTLFCRALKVPLR